MTKTEHYQLNQWAGEDRVLRTDFNEDNARIDAALESVRAGAEAALNGKAAEVQTALEGKLRTVQSALDEQKQEAQAALDAKAEELQSAITSGDSSLRSSLSSTSSSLSTLQSTVSSHTGSSTLHAFVKLGSVNVAAGKSSTFSVSGSGYTMLVLDVNCKSSENAVTAAVNGSGELKLASIGYAPIHAVAFLFPLAGTSTGCMSLSVSTKGSNTFGSTADTAWSAMRSLTFSTTDSATTITVYGVKA